MGRSRMRLSGSAVATWERCPRQWFHGTKQGVRGAVHPPLVMGTLVEDGLVGLLMESPFGPQRHHWVEFSRSEHPADDLDELPELDTVEIGSLADLKAWLKTRIAPIVDEIVRRGEIDWQSRPHRQAGSQWSDMQPEFFERLLQGGIVLQLEEVAACLAAGGGPHLDLWREGGDPHHTPAPAWCSPPCHPVPEKVPTHLSAPDTYSALPMLSSGARIDLIEAWIIARPWMKDPRAWQPQRLYHPEKWGAGELDVLARWSGKARIIDIKASAGTSGWSGGLVHQLRFYGWLWLSTREELKASSDKLVIDELEGLEGWYLNGPHRKQIEFVSSAEMEAETERLYAIYEQMASATLEDGNQPPAEPSQWIKFSPGGTPAAEQQDEQEAREATCENCGAGFLCSARSEQQRSDAIQALLPPSLAGQSISDLAESLQTKPPVLPIVDIPSRVNVKGKLHGFWGPMSNHFGEQVLGAVLTSGSVSAVIEEMTPESFQTLHDNPEAEYAIMDGAPGQWRGTPRLYLDDRSRIIPLEEADDDIEYIRLGLMPTRANCEGLVVALGGMSGKRLDGRPWRMRACHIWDGSDVIEVVAFGSMSSQAFGDLQAGDRLRVIAGELGWRAGLSQLRINSRSTRIEVWKGD